MSRKKTLYEILEVPANASSHDIRAAHRRKLQKLQSAEAGISREDFAYRLQMLKLALDTLSDPALRWEYDEKLMSRPPSAEAAPAQVPAVPADDDPLARRADVLALRADALALRADAMSIKGDVSLLRGDDGPQPLASRFLSGLKSPLRATVVVVGSLAAIAMLAQTAFVFFAVRHNEDATAAAARAEEQVVIQDYYQRYGERPASAAEARLLEQERQRQENEARAEEREKEKTEERARRFQEEAKREGERISAELRYAEEQLRHEEERKKAQKEEEEQRRQAAEEERLQRERERWDRVLSRKPSDSY